jgi:hypothetical protein
MSTRLKNSAWPSQNETLPRRSAAKRFLATEWPRARLDYR